MTTAAENELLTRVGPGTRMGALLRRYWQPVAAVDEMKGVWTKRVRILGEDLVLYRSRSDEYGLIGEFCPHRRASLAYGIPTKDGIRCMYHGWEFNQRGECIDQPNEGRHALRGKNISPAYPVKELGGLLFAYLGPQPAPELPRFDAFVIGGGVRAIGKAMIPCNWLQIMENSVDPVHTQWLHGALFEFLNEGKGLKTVISRKQSKSGFDEFEFGIIKRRMFADQTEASDDWKVGHPLLFPNALSVGSGGGAWQHHTLQYRVPIDDTHTMHYWYHVYILPDEAKVPEHLKTQTPPVYDVPYRNEAGEFLLDYIHAQDIMAWVTQGPIADRTEENLGASDQGVVLLRRMLKREVERMEQGEDPLGIIRDPARNTVIDLPMEKNKSNHGDGFEAYFTRHNTLFAPFAKDVLEAMRGLEQKGKAKVAAPA
ncbi:MAG TPA: aromatic ring-hydroxylating dioxygenase subunit alpha [Xanthobacteraceae bacterium]|nr:aromatic ring-hydroxylating dioxygenase subunit alpha [Xanthobacteraceae bacterium]